MVNRGIKEKRISMNEQQGSDKVEIKILEI